MEFHFLNINIQAICSLYLAVVCYIRDTPEGVMNPYLHNQPYVHVNVYAKYIFVDLNKKIVKRLLHCWS